MAYNSYIPYYTYGNNYYQPQNIPSSPSNDIIWVQGEAGAKAYLVAPNTTITLWDSESPTIYVKSSDSRGIPSMRILDFTERSLASPNAPNFNFTPSPNKTPISDEINALRSKYDVIEGKVKTLEEKILNITDKEGDKS